MSASRWSARWAVRWTTRLSARWESLVESVAVTRWGPTEVSNGNHVLTGRLNGWTVDHGWWFGAFEWSLGISFMWDLKPRPYSGEGGRVILSIEVGPFTWGIYLQQPYVDSRADGKGIEFLSLIRDELLDEMRMIKRSSDHLGIPLVIKPLREQ